MDTQVRGPKALMKSGIVPDGLTLLALNSNKEIQFMGAPENWTTDESTFVLVSKNENDDFDSLKKKLVELSDSIRDAKDAHCLDALIQSGNRWWSAICDDTRCCPVEGNIVDDTKEANVEMVDKIIEDLKKDDIPSTDFELVVNNIDMRDDLLIKLSQNNLWDAIIKLTSDYKSAQALTVQACAWYAGENLGKTKEYIELVNEAGGTSLADLVWMGLDMKVPGRIFLNGLKSLAKQS